MILHVVRSGETMLSIANEYQVSETRLRSDNGMSQTQMPCVGQALLVLYPERTYTVKEGDTPLSIANENGISLRQLQRNNPSIATEKDIYPNQTLILSYENEQRGNILSVGYTYPFIEQSTLETTLPYLSLLTPFTYGIKEDGSLMYIHNTELTDTARSLGTKTVLMVSTLGEDGIFNGELPKQIFSNKEITTRLVENIVSTAQSQGFSYIDSDFEFMPREAAQDFAYFISQLRTAANAVGIKVIVALAPKTSGTMQGALYEGHLYPEIGQNSDYVLLMTYEWGYTYSPPQAVAPIDKVRAVLEYAHRVIPGHKILLGIPNYGYDWKLPFVASESKATSISNTDAVLLAEKTQAEIQFDPIAMSPYFYYTDENSDPHVVWFEDARSILQKLNLIPEYNLAGFSVWNILRWFPALWLEANALYEIEE